MDNKEKNMRKNKYYNQMEGEYNIIQVVLMCMIITFILISLLILCVKTKNWEENYKANYEMEMSNYEIMNIESMINNMKDNMKKN